MAEEKIIFQTLENRGDFDKVEMYGPYKCKWPNTWLGDGFYFWDTFIENAHWWGKKHRNGNYIICEAQFLFDTSTCFDLVGSTSHMVEMNDAVNLMNEKGLIDSKTTTARVIAYLRDSLNIFNYSAVRVWGVNSQSEKYWKKYGLLFELNKPFYLHMKPAIQICIFNWTAINAKNYKVVFPDEEYAEDYLL